MKDLHCSGAEMEIDSCVWSEPDEVCADHAHDTVIYCAADALAPIPEEGTLRLLSSDEAPAVDGTGRLEVFFAGSSLRLS
jgi:hypothetical protein